MYILGTEDVPFSAVLISQHCYDADFTIWFENGINFWDFGKTNEWAIFQTLT